MDPNNSLAAFQPQQQSQPLQQQQPQRMVSQTGMTNFDDEAVSKYEFDLYQGKTGNVDHIQVLLPGPNPLGKGRSHFHEKLKGGGILCRSEYKLAPDGKREILVQEANCCKWLGQSSQRFAALIVQYGTLPNGQVITSPFKYYLKVWRFGVDKFKTLQAINRDFPLNSHDLTVSCSDETYQKMTIGAKNSCILHHPNFPPEHKQTIEQWAASSVGKLSNEVGGRRFDNDQQLATYLQQNGVIFQGAPAGPVPTMVPGDAPVSNFDDIINVTPVVK